MGNIDKKRTMMSAFKRNAMKGEPAFHPIYKEDLKFKTWNEITKARIECSCHCNDGYKWIRWEYGKNIWPAAFSSG